jgi:predicted transcriptional regulator
MASLNLGALGKRIKSAQELRVFLYLLGRLKYGMNNLIEITQAAIAAELGMRQSNVALALKRLEERGIVTHEGRGEYQVSPELAWRGYTEDHQHAIEEWRNLRAWRAAGISDRDRVIIWEQWQTQAQ